MNNVLDGLEALDQESDEFWQHQEDGLALVITESGELNAYQVPYTLPEKVWVGEGPHLGALLPLLNPRHVYCLALDLNELKLYEATQWETTEIRLKDIPTSLDEAMKYDDPEQSLQFHSASGNGDATFHGQGLTGDENRNKKIRRYFEMVSAGLTKQFADKEAPLVLMGPDAEIGLYRELNHYPHLFEDSIRFNPSNLSDDERDSHITDWVREWEQSHLQQLLSDLENHLAHDKGSTDLKELAAAALTGRVATLFVRSNAEQFGSYDLETDKLVLHDQYQPGDDELVNMIATSAVMNGADIYSLPGDTQDLPEGSAMGAIFRY